MKDLLTKTVWNYKDIIRFDKLQGIRTSKTRAYKIIDLAKKDHNGSVALKSTYAKRDSVLAVYGTTPGKEMYLWLKRNQSDTKAEPNG